jgi:hypothetical protein
MLNGFGGTLIGIGVLWICITCFMRERISLAINLIKESASALIQIPLLLFMPFFQVLLFAGFTALWLYYCIYLISSGTVVNHTDSVTGFSYHTISYDKHSQQAIFLMVFIWFWTIGFIEAAGQIGSAHVILKWYFATHRSSITSLQVFASFFVALRYHSGTAALGSFIIAVFKIIRLTLEYCKYQLTKSKAVNPIGCFNLHLRVLRCLLSCLICIFYCLEKWIKFFNKHAYIQVAMKGTGFFHSAYSAFKLLVKNLGRLAAVTVIGDLVVIIGKLSISLSCAALGYLYLSTYMREELNGFILPTVFIFFLALLTATMFLNVLSATADTLLQACLIDEEIVHSGNTEAHHKDLKDLVLKNKQSWRSHASYDNYDDGEGEGAIHAHGDLDLNEIELQQQTTTTTAGAKPSGVLPDLLGRYAVVDQNQQQEINLGGSNPTSPAPLLMKVSDNSGHHTFEAKSIPWHVGKNKDYHIDDDEAFNPGGRNKRYATKK